MSRPYMQLTIVDLEGIFESIAKSLPLSLEAVTKLKALEEELGHRQTPRAVPLRSKVEKALAGKGPEGGRLTPAPVTIPAPAWRPVEPPIAQGDSGVPKPAPAAQPKPAQPPAIPLQDALEVLKLPANATWEELERRRRTVVQQSSPARTRSMAAAERGRLLQKAQLANAAVASIVRARIERTAG